MKNKKLNEKLSLRKRTVAYLADAETKKIKGGTTLPTVIHASCKCNVSDEQSNCPGCALFS